MAVSDETYMRRCIQLAKNGFHNAPPNPMVGAVVVYDGRIIGEGYHVRCGEGHAEVNALASVRREEEHLLADSTIYVSLEPCSHYGNTPPCANLIVEKRLRRCVIGCLDPFAKVHGKGVEILRSAGVDVTVGVLEEECKALNRRFMTYHSLHRPFITLKWAQTADGFIAYKNQNPDMPLIISNDITKMICHKRRSEHHAILIGRKTLEADNPRLDVRLWNGKNPLPVVLAGEESIQALKADCRYKYHLLANESTLFFHSINDLIEGLYDRGIQCLLVEGGRHVLQTFIDCGLWDEAYVETGTQWIGDGVEAPVISETYLSGIDHYSGNVIKSYKK